MDFLNSTVYYGTCIIIWTAQPFWTSSIYEVQLSPYNICLFSVVANIIKEWEITFSTHWDTMFIYRSYVCFLSVTSSIENSIFIHQEFKMESFITDSLWETGRKLGMGVYIIIFFTIKLVSLENKWKWSIRKAKSISWKFYYLQKNYL